MRGVNLCRRIAAVCNEMGQYVYKQACGLLPLAGDSMGVDPSAPPTNRMQRLCDAAEINYEYAMSLFEAVHDSLNLSAVLCNASSLKRLCAMNGPHVAQMLLQAIAMCNRAHAALGERTNGMWDRVNQEAANCYLSLGA